MSYEFEYIAVHHADGRVTRLQFVIRAPASAFDQYGATQAGFIFDPATQEWAREATRANVEREIQRAAIPKNMDAWKVINRADMVNVRENYATIPERKILRNA